MGWMRHLAGQLARIWNNYWFSHPAQFSQGICRLAVAWAAFMTMGRVDSPDWGAVLAEYDQSNYVAHGLMGWLPGRPSAEFLTVAQWLGTVGTLCWAVGLALPVSGIFSFLGLFDIDSFRESLRGNYGWCHGFNFILLAQLAMMFSSRRDVLSVDYWLRRGWAAWRGQPAAIVEPQASSWPILLAQASLGISFLNAAWFKMTSVSFGAWIFSDNMRNILLRRYQVLGHSMPDFAQWLADNEILYKGAALGNVIAQAAIILTCFLIKRPWLRALVGLFYVLELVALGQVMGLWHPNLVPLYALFVDWDALARGLSRLASKCRFSWPTQFVNLPQDTPTVGQRLATAHIVVFLAFFWTVAFILPHDFELEVHGTESLAGETPFDVRYLPPGGDGFLPLEGNWQCNRFYFQRPRTGYQFIALGGEVLDRAGL